MRQLLPDNNNIKCLNGDSTRPVTRKEFDELIAEFSQLHSDVEQYELELNDFKSQLETAFTTGTLSADNINALAAIIGDLQTTNLTSDAATITEADINEIRSAVARLTNVIASDISTTTITAGTGNITNINASDITTADLTITNNLTLNNTTITDATIATETVGDSDINNAAISCATISDADINNETVTNSTVTNATITNAAITSIDAIKADIQFTYHNDNYQFINAIEEDYWIELPWFSNGDYRLVGLANDSYAYSITIRNELNNIFAMWTQVLPNYIQHIYIYDNNTMEPKVYLHMHTLNKYIKVFARADSEKCTSVPIIHSDGLPFDPTTDGTVIYEVKLLSGGKFFKPVDVYNSEGYPGVLSLGYTTDHSLTDCDPVQFDGTQDISKMMYWPDQELNKTSSVEFNQICAKDIYDPEDPSVLLSEGLVDTPNIQVSCVADLPHITAMSECSPTPEALTDGNLIADCTGLYIKRTDSSSCPQLNPLASFHAECYPISDNALLAYNCEDNSIKPADDVNIVGNLTITGCTTACGPIYAKESIEAKTISTSGDLIVGQDLYVCGKEYVSDVEAIESNSDYLVLRSNNNTSLGNNYSGVIVNNYDGSNNLAVVTDCTGELRISTGGSESTTTLTDKYLFNNVYYDTTITPIASPSGYLSSFNNDELTGAVLYSGAFYAYNNGKWYATAIDANDKLVLDSEVTSQATIDDLELETKYKLFYYRTAVFKEISVTNAEPIATRDEASNMCDGAPVVWDASCTRLVTKAAQCGGQKFVTVDCDPSDPTCGFTYEWVNDVPAAVICCYATCADYLSDLANVRAGYQIVIMDETSYVEGEMR